MRILRFLAVVIVLTNVLFAKAHEGTFKLSEFRDGRKNSFDTNIEVRYSIDVLMGEPVVKADAKYTIGDFVDIDGHSYKRTQLKKERLDKLKIIDLKIRAPFETTSINKQLYIDIDMGAMGKAGEWSYNTPGSPDWNKWIMYKDGTYLNKEDAIKAYKGFLRLGINDTWVSLAKAITIKYDISGVKEKKLEPLKNVWIDKETGLMWQDEEYNQEEVDNYVKYYEQEKNVGKTGSWYHADEYCQKLRLDGFNDWRLPSINELSSIKDKRNNFVYQVVFRNIWSSDTAGDEAKKFRFHYYIQGDEPIALNSKTRVSYIKCVRSKK
ncbi:DUF1566 domain-containing protein [bacterium]|nr:DUF1566 domain-containing protein [bacterium]